MPSSTEVAKLLRERGQIAYWARETRNPNYAANKWMSVVAEEKQNQEKMAPRIEAACVVGFAASSALPADIAKNVASFIPVPFTARTVLRTICVARCDRDQEPKVRGGYGRQRGGEGLHCTEKWKVNHQRPMLPFSEYQFQRDIMFAAHLSTSRRLKLQGTHDERLSALLLTLIFHG